MNSDSWVGKIYRGLSLIYVCAGLNVLFLLGTVAGLGIFGLAPSLLTTFHLAKLHHRQELNHPFKEYWRFYKKHFLTANKMLLPLFIVMAFTIWDGYLFQDSRGVLVALVVVEVILALMVIYASSMWQFYQLTPKVCLQKAFQFIFYNFLGSILTLLFSGICFYGSYLLPGIIPFFAIGFWCMVVMGIHLRLFEVNEEKLTKEATTNHDAEVVNPSTDAPASHHLWPSVDKGRASQR